MRTEAFYILYALGDFTNLVEGVLPIIAEGGPKKSTYPFHLLGWSNPAKVVVNSANPSGAHYVSVFKSFGDAGYKIMDLVSLDKSTIPVVMRDSHKNLFDTQKYIPSERDPRTSPEGGPGQMPLFGFWLIAQSNDPRIPPVACVQLIPLANAPVQGALVRLNGHTLEGDTGTLFWNERPNETPPSLTMHILMPEGTSCIVRQQNIRVRLTMRDGTLTCAKVVPTP